MRPSRLRPLARPAIFTASFTMVLLGLAACQTTDLDITGALSDKAEPPRPADPRAEVELSRDRFRKTPGDPEVALKYGQALRAMGQRTQAVAVLEQATISNPTDKA